MDQHGSRTGNRGLSRAAGTLDRQGAQDAVHVPDVGTSSTGPQRDGSSVSHGKPVVACPRDCGFPGVGLDRALRQRLCSPSPERGPSFQADDGEHLGRGNQIRWRHWCWSDGRNTPAATLTCGPLYFGCSHVPSVSAGDWPDPGRATGAAGAIHFQGVISCLWVQDSQFSYGIA